MGSKSRMQGKITSVGAGDAVYVGIDVCKAWLDVYLHPTGQSFRVPNSKEGIRRLRKELGRTKVALVIVEATGKLHRLVHRMLSQAGYPVAAVNPSRPHEFAKAIGQLAKTDKIDARLLALYGACLSPRVTPVPAVTVAELQELVLARQAATADETAIKNRYGAAESGLLKRLLKKQLPACERMIAKLEEAIAALIESDPVLTPPGRRDAVAAVVQASPLPGGEGQGEGRLALFEAPPCGNAGAIRCLDGDCEPWCNATLTLPATGSPPRRKRYSTLK